MASEKLQVWLQQAEKNNPDRFITINEHMITKHSKHLSMLLDQHVTYVNSTKNEQARQAIREALEQRGICSFRNVIYIDKAKLIEFIDKQFESDDKESSSSK